MIVLGIETSCDETSASIVIDGRIIASNIVSSQIDVHRPFGGVVPELASRHHIENITYIVSESLKEASIKSSEIDLIAVTRGPGLVGSLLAGIMFAQGFSEGLSCPLVGINHLEGHLFASLMENVELSFPFLSLLVSGGHTLLVAAHSVGNYSILGQTIDDAAGEAFDKVAKILGLGYPGGPIIDKLSKKDANSENIRFPRPLLKSNNFDFSFSGLKTAVFYYVRDSIKDSSGSIPEKDVVKIASSFQEAVVETLVSKTFSALKETGINKCVIGGGVAANDFLRKEFIERGDKEDVQVFLPSKAFCTDNAAMIASCAYFRKKHGFDKETEVEVNPRLKLGEQ